MWAFMLRMDLHSLGADSVNKYAIGECSNNYTNYIAVFSKINLARLHTEIGNMNIQITIKDSPDKTGEQKSLAKLLIKMKGL